MRTAPQCSTATPTNYFLTPNEKGYANHGVVFFFFRKR
nr:MAG TPA: hypothetical protein [Caudoviricetes sp.]